MENQVVKVKRETITACMTCPLCNDLFNEATTITECLHTLRVLAENFPPRSLLSFLAFSKCIYDKITDEELECCPVCNIDLGCVPIEKLRPDHNLQDLRAKIFPLKTCKLKAPEVVPSVTQPARRKERSLSSLVVSTPRVSTQATMTGRRTKPTRKASAARSSSFSIEKPIIKEEDSVEEPQENSSSPDTSNKFTQSTGQSLSPPDASQSAPNKETDNGAEEAKDLWKPLNCLVEVASRSKSFKSNMQGSDAKLEPAQVNENDSQVQKSKIKENRRKAKVEEEKTGTDPVSSDTAKANKSRRNRKKKEPVSGESGISPQAVLDANSARLSTRTGPIWFSLIASDDQLLLQGRRCTITPSFCKLFKDKLSAYADIFLFMVEIKCMGQPVDPTLLLNNLIDLWLQTSSPSQRFSATVGSSAKDFVMVLNYARKAPPA
ncbi:E3 ubiquitin protein ligase DRIP2-like [Senna tora]|uniref:E3 ubiquitin protein ligase DRIP2-like n=1 Tax=Senna tora TaxID=362788 RepID=A0A834TA40_9FABA|nr:E3 ubiquitin protein ligase DRIP2-like [Senna tora]